MASVNRPIKHDQVRQATILTAVIHLLLGIAKICFGILGHSHALIADGLHSFADLLTDGLVIIASRLGGQAADMEHPYGHARIETMGAVVLSMILFIVGTGILAEALQQIFFLPPSLSPHFIVLVVALISIVANEGLFHYLKWIATRVQSRLLLSNAWHCRSDAISSIVVLLGAGAAYGGFKHFDALAAVVVGLLIMKMAWDLGWPCLRELVDTGIVSERLISLEKIIQETPGVKALHQLRTRLMAGDVYVDVHVLVASNLSVSEGHYIGELVEKRLLDSISEVKDVIVHIDPEDDEVFPFKADLPSRKDLLENLEKTWQNYPAFEKIQQVRLHYLSGLIHVEIYFPYGCVSEKEVVCLVEQYCQSKTVCTDIAEVAIFFMVV